MTLALNLALHPGSEISVLPLGMPASIGQALIATNVPASGGQVQLAWGAGGGGPTGTLPVATAEGQFLVSGSAAASYAWQPLPLDFGAY
jgi:hypothetical protein